MGKKSGSSKNSSTRPVTRSRASASTGSNGDLTKEDTNKIADITYYTKMSDPTTGQINQKGKSHQT